MFENDNPKQPFFIINRVDIFPCDLRVLIKLYQPLIGSVALSLYLSLNEDYSPQTIISDAQGIFRLQEQIDCDIKRLFVALHKLEAVGLVETRALENEIMGQILCFKLNSVPTSSEFFSTALLSSLLKEKVGVTAFRQLSTDFADAAKRNESQINGIKNAQNISASFMDVFHLPAAEAIDPSVDVKEAAHENKLIPKNKAQINARESIDWDFMKQQFEIYQIAASEVDQNREAIRSLMQTYGLSEQEFVDEAIPCLHGDYHLNMSLIKNTIANSIHADNTRQRLKKSTQFNGNQAVKNTHLRKDEQELLQKAQSQSPAQFLYQLKASRDDYVDASEYKVLDSLYNEKGIPAELLNILTYACLKSGTNISFRLANKILHDWLQHGVKSGAQALEYMANRKKAQEQKRKLYSHFPARKRVEKGTNWNQKKAQVKSDVSANDLKKFFKNFEKQSGMK